MIHESIWGVWSHHRLPEVTKSVPIPVVILIHDDWMIWGCHNWDLHDSFYGQESATDPLGIYQECSQFERAGVPLPWKLALKNRPEKDGRYLQ